MRNRLPVLGILLVVALCASCDQRTHVLNTSPAVTTVGPVSLDDETINVIFWVRDHEEDAVDIEIDIVHGDVVKRVELFGGHGDVGLTTNREPEGKAHPIQFKRLELEPTDSIRLRIRALDDHGEISAVYETDEFVLVDGLPAP